MTILKYWLHKQFMFRSNSNLRSVFMKKKKKEKIKKLDDRAYGEYISSLKEETPIDEYKK